MIWEHVGQHVPTSAHHYKYIPSNSQVVHNSEGARKNSLGARKNSLGSRWPHFGAWLGSIFTAGKINRCPRGPPTEFLRPGAKNDLNQEPKKRHRQTKVTKVSLKVKLLTQIYNWKWLPNMGATCMTNVSSVCSAVVLMFPKPSNVSSFCIGLKDFASPSHHPMVD